MAKTTIITDRLNSFFTNNKIEIRTGKPSSGSYKKGDIIVNIGTNNTTEPMWVCVEDGSPGVWAVVGAGVIGNGSITMDKLADDIKQAIEKAKDLDTTQFALKTDLNKTNANVNTNKTDISNLRSDLNTTNDNVTTVTNMANTNKTDISNLTNRVSTNETNITTVTNTANTNKTDISNLRSDLNKTNSNVTSVTNMANTNKTNIGTISNLNTNIKDNLVNAINELNNKIGNNAELMIDIYNNTLDYL
jgi:methyl-accepting chemotaxis protein